MLRWCTISLPLVLSGGMALAGEAGTTALGPAPESAVSEDRTAKLASMLERVQELGDRTPSRYFYRIAEGRDTQAFSVLKEALAVLTDPGAAQAAFGACSLFKGSVIEEHVVNWLAKQSFKAEHTSRQLGATQALTYFWRSAPEELLRVLRSHPSKSCRETALEPMLPLLVLRGDRNSCKLLIDNADPNGRGRAALTAALRHFDSIQTETFLASILRAKDTPREMKLLLLDQFAERDSNIARIAIDKRLSDSDEDVRLRALDILGRQGDPEILRKLSSIAQRGSSEFVTSAILSLADKKEGDPNWIAELYSFTQSHNSAVRCGAAEALGRLPTQDALTLLHRLLSDREIEVKLTALRIIAERRQLQSVPKLLAALGDPQDLVTHEVARTLRLLTGRDHGVSRKRWESWFNAEGPGLQVPTLEEALELERERTARKNPTGKYRTASFYGLRIRSNKVCFIIDTSGSMADPAGGRGTSSTSKRETRLSVAKKELSNSLNQLLNGVRFNIVSFASEVRAYKNELIELDAKSRVQALKRVEKLHAVGGTAIYDALVLALKDKEIEAIYLLTDGAPTEGEIVDIDQILARIQNLTRHRDVKIHGIAIGQRSRLLRTLARDTGGQYIEIF